jgi:hypothetical protein
MQLMQPLNCSYWSSCAGVCRYSPWASVRGSLGMMYGLMDSSLLDEVVDDDHQIALDREMRQRARSAPARVVDRAGRSARQLGHAVDHHAAAAADGHAARPAEGQRGVELVLDVLQPCSTDMSSVNGTV